MDAVISSLDKKYKLCDTQIKDSEIILYISSVQKSIFCPYCKSETNKIHSYHIRKIQDLPICNQKTVLMVTTRKMKCINPDCSQKFFSEQHTFAEANAQKTNRLIERILKTSSEVSSVCSGRLLKNEGIAVGKSSICMLLKKNSSTCG